MSRETYQDLSALAFVSAMALLRAIVIERVREYEEERAVRVKGSLEQERAWLGTKLAELAPIKTDPSWRESLEILAGLKPGKERRRYERQLQRTEAELASLARGGKRASLFRGSLSGLEPLIEGYILLVFAVIVCGFTLLGLLLPLLTYFVLPLDAQTIKRINRQYLVSLIIAVGAAGAVYVTNELMK